METKKISQLPVLESLPETAHVMVEDGGMAKRVPQSAMTVKTDATLTQEGASADAKAVGDAVSQLSGEIGDLVETTTAEFLPEVTVTTENSENHAYGGMGSTAAQLTVGETYVVTFDGAAYACVAWYYSGWGAVCLGNGAIIGASEGNGEPFAIDSYSDGDIYLDTAEAGTHTVRIKKRKTLCFLIPPTKKSSRIRL